MNEEKTQIADGVASVCIYAIERLENDGKWVECVCFKDCRQKALGYFKHWTGITRLKNTTTFEVLKTNEVILSLD